MFLAVHAYSTGRHLHGMGSGNFGWTQAIFTDPVSSNSVFCRDVPSASVDDKATFGAKPHTRGGKFLVVQAYFLERHLHGTGPDNIGRTWAISGLPVSPNAVPCREVFGTSLHDPAAAGPRAHRSLRSVLDRVRMLFRPAFARHGP